jgi:membrane-associated phospholipid phosphatase
VTRSDRIRTGLAAAGLAVAALAVSVVVAGAGVGGWEKDVVNEAVGVTDIVGYPARAVMQLGTQTALLGSALVVLCLTRRWRPPVAVLVAGWAAWLATNRAKMIIERPRPDQDLWRESSGTWGYPSGHTSTAFAVATVVAALLPRRWRWAPFVAATIVGLARMHVGVHYPMDVVGGALIGLATGLAAVALLDPARQADR